MAILPPVIEVEGEEATIEAGHLAAKLGLSVDRLRAEMRGASSTAWSSGASARTPVGCA